MRQMMLAAIALLIMTSPDVHADFDKARCAAVKEKIRHIQSRMRAGYTRAQGERMEKQLRKLKKQRRSICR